MAATLTTAGTEFAQTVLRNFHIGPRTRRYRDGVDLHAEVIESITHAMYLPGYHSENTERAYRLATGAVMSYQKHVLGYRIDGGLNARIQQMSPRQFVLFLADMIDAGVETVGDGERYLNGLR